MVSNAVLQKRQEEALQRLTLECPICGARIPWRDLGEIWVQRAAKARYDGQGVSREYLCDACASRWERGLYW